MKKFWMMVNYETGEILGMDEARTQKDALNLFTHYQPNLNGFVMVPNMMVLQARNPHKTA